MENVEEGESVGGRDEGRERRRGGRWKKEKLELLVLAIYNSNTFLPSFPSSVHFFPLFFLLSCFPLRLFHSAHFFLLSAFPFVFESSFFFSSPFPFPRFPLSSFSYPTFFSLSFSLFSIIFLFSSHVSLLHPFAFCCVFRGRSATRDSQNRVPLVH